VNPYQVDDLALISIDNTQGFENKTLNELYVSGGEQAALATKKAIELCKSYDMEIINVFDAHPKGHILFANNYKEKQPYDTITYEEIKDWTPEQNGIGERATFTVDELKKFLVQTKGQQETLRPDHCIQFTSGVELMNPLEKKDFDLHISKGVSPTSAGYSGFEDTSLDIELKKRGKKTLILTGIATDYCVGQTALDAIDKNYQTYLLSEAIRGVSLDTTQAKLNDLFNAGVKIITLNQLSNILSKNFT
jgi:nicotinamidase-related amidase